MDSSGLGALVTNFKIAQQQGTDKLYTVKSAYHYILTADSLHYRPHVLRQCSLNDYLNINLTFDELRTELVNTISASGVSDLPLTLIVFGFAIAGFVIGVFPFTQPAGLFALGATGGLSIGVRLVISRAGLLLPFSADWVISALLGAGGGALVLFTRRIGIVSNLPPLSRDQVH